MLVEQRYAKILEKLKINGIVKTADLKRELNASSETIRKDLTYLDEAGYLNRIHGGAVIRDNPQLGSNKDDFIAFAVRQSQNCDMKRAIAISAANLIQEGQSVALDSGTTSFELAKVLKEKFNKLTIVTNSLINAYELVDKEGFTVIATGGILTADENSFVSDFATLILDKINVDIMFLTTCGVSLENGITDQRMDEVIVHNKMRDCSKKVVVLADNTKFGAISLIRVCDLDDIDFIVTDANIDMDLAEKFKQSGHNIIIAD